MNFSLHQALESLPLERQPQAKEKTSRLVEYLRSHYNTELRDDSRLAWVYVTSLPDTELDSIGREIWYTKLLYSYTNYADLCRDMLPLVKLSLNRRNMDGNMPTTPLEEQRTWAHIQNYVIPSIQLDCMVHLMERAGLDLKNINATAVVDVETPTTAVATPTTAVATPTAHYCC